MDLTSLGHKLNQAWKLGQGSTHLKCGRVGLEMILTGIVATGGEDNSKMAPPWGISHLLPVACWTAFKSWKKNEVFVSFHSISLE